MIASTEYTDREQTPAQRKELIDKARAWNVAQGATPGPAAEAVYARYVAGELTLQGVTDELVKHYTNRDSSKHILVMSPKPQLKTQMQPEQLELV